MVEEHIQITFFSIKRVFDRNGKALFEKCFYAFLKQTGTNHKVLPLVTLLITLLSLMTKGAAQPSPAQTKGRPLVIRARVTVINT